MTLDQIYPRLLDAMITEHAGGFSSRKEVREQVEKMLDKMRPAENPEGWGRSMSKQQWEHMMGSKKKKAAADGG